MPLTRRLAEALNGARHLRNRRVPCADGKSVTQKVVQVAVRRAARRANVRPGVHILRHTFCSRLAMCVGRRQERFRSGNAEGRKSQSA